MSSQRTHIVVLGAGVIGLQTALSLLAADYRVSIIAAHVPGDTDGEYASPWAGAHWRTHAERSEGEVCGWDGESYREWMGMGREERGRCGLGVCTSLQYWASSTPEITPSPSSLWWSTLVSDFAIIPPSALPPNTHAGVSYTSLTINVPIYLSHLLHSFLSHPSHPHLIQASLPLSSFAAALAHAQRELLKGQHVDAWVNATGLGARKLVGDEGVYPVRGQTVLVEGEARGVSTRVGRGPGETAYVIPREGSGTTVLGGTREVGCWDATPDPETTERILRACKKLAPELLDESGELVVLSVSVGLRPARKGGPRVEVEEVVGREAEGEGKGKRWTVVHCYGHAGAGYQNSVGSARKVVRLLEEHDKGLKKGAKL